MIIAKKVTRQFSFECLQLILWKEVIFTIKVHLTNIIYTITVLHTLLTSFFFFFHSSLCILFSTGFVALYRLPTIHIHTYTTVYYILLYILDDVGSALRVLYHCRRLSRPMEKELSAEVKSFRPVQSKLSDFRERLESLLKLSVFCNSSLEFI